MTKYLWVMFLVFCMSIVTSAQPVPLPAIQPKVSIKADAPPFMIDGSFAKGEVEWIEYDKARCTVDGKKLWFSSPTIGVFRVRMVSFDDKKSYPCEITVTGVDPVPEKVDPVAKLSKDVEMLEMVLLSQDDKIKALERKLSAADPVVVALQASFSKLADKFDTLSESIAKIDAQLVILQRRPDPVPPKPPAPKSGKIARHVSLVVDIGDKAEVSPDVRKWFADRNILLHTDVFSNGKEVVDSKGKVVGGLILAVKKAGGAPAAVVQDSVGNIIDQGRLETEDGLKSLVAPHTK